MSEAPVAIPRSRALALGEPGSRLLLAWPEGDPPAEGWPLLLLLDGDTTFATAVEAARLQSRRPQVTGVTPCVIAALCQPRALRERDFTPPGADDFLAFVEQAALPAIAAIQPCDPARRAIFGHSMAGYFVLHALFARPGLFARSIAASPSIWWDAAHLRHGADRLLAVPARTDIRLLMLLGGLELDDPNIDAARRARLGERRMGEHAHDLAARLAPGLPGTRVVVLAGENHASVVPAAISRALRFALEPAA